MFWPFKKKQKPSALLHFVFKDGHTFFELQCKYGDTDIQPNKGVVAIVVDAAKEYGTNVAVKIETDGRQMAVLRVASDNGGFITFAHTPSNGGDRLKPDDVVIWVPMEYSQELAQKASDPNLGWVGLIVAKVKPELVPEGKFIVACTY